MCFYGSLRQHECLSSDAFYPQKCHEYAVYLKAFCSSSLWPSNDNVFSFVLKLLLHPNITRKCIPKSWTIISKHSSSGNRLTWLLHKFYVLIPSFIRVFHTKGKTFWAMSDAYLNIQCFTKFWAKIGYFGPKSAWINPSLAQRNCIMLYTVSTEIWSWLKVLSSLKS